MEIVFCEMQIQFYVFDLKNMGYNFFLDDGFNLLKFLVKEVDNDGVLIFIVFMYDLYDMIICDGIYLGGWKVIIFVNVL